MSTGKGAGSRGDISKAQAVVDDITAAGGIAVADGGSAGEFEDVRAMVDSAVSRWGRLDIAIVNAGVYRDRRIERVSEEDFDVTFQVHVKVQGRGSDTAAPWPPCAPKAHGKTAGSDVPPLQCCRALSTS